MKKSLIALFVAAFCFSSMAGVLVYDFNASFKRLDVKDVKYKDKDSKSTMHMDSAKVVSDKFTGYMVIEDCKSCKGQMEHSYTPGNTNVAVFYIVRKGDKRKNVYRAVSTFDALMFGSKTIRTKLEAGTAGDWVNKDKFTDALGDFKIPLVWDPAMEYDKDGVDDGEKLDTNYKDFTYGFLGMDNYSSASNYLYGQGYGKVVKQKTARKSSVWCGDDKTDYDYCWRVKNLSGSVIGDTNYAGHCSDFLFDVCSNEKMDDKGNRTGVYDDTLRDVGKDAVLPGTFTLKLNNGLTFGKDGASNFTTFEEAEEEILEKLKAEEKTIFIPKKDDGKTQELNDGKVWGK